MDLKLEAILLPVSDVERSKQFYKGLGWREDADFAGDDGYRIVQLTPPGSPCSIQFGAGLTADEPGSLQGLLLVVDDIEAARDDLAANGAPIGEVFHDAGPLPRARFHPEDASLRVAGPAPGHATYRSFATFDDPDGNGWVLQEITTRLPGRGGAPSVGAATLTELLREAEEQHGRYEPTAPKHHWSGWYSAFIVARQQGRTAQEAYDDASAALAAGA
jgi:catechol 2,3-dioxygenase-like lactoylglutathione lyase family enzyme